MLSISLLIEGIAFCVTYTGSGVWQVEKGYETQRAWGLIVRDGLTLVGTIPPNRKTIIPCSRRHFSFERFSAQ